MQIKIINFIILYSILHLAMVPCCARSLHQGRVDIHTMNFRHFDYVRESSISRGLEIDDYEIQSFENYSLYYILNNFLYKITTFPLSIEEKPKKLPNEMKIREENQPKYRNGSWYYRDGNKILKHVNNKGWETILDSKIFFSQFELSPDGNILLICSGIFQVPGRRGSPFMNLGLCVEDSLRFISVWETGGEKPLKEISLPSDFAGVEKSVSGITGPLRSFWVDDKMVISHDELGLLWCLDWSDFKIHEIQTPWQSLNWKFIEQHQKILTTVHSAFGQIGISQYHFPQSMHFYPFDSNSLFIVYRGYKILPTLVKRVANLKSHSNSGLEGLIQLEPKDESTIGFYELNLSEFSVKTISLSAIENAKLRQRLAESDLATKPFWVQFDGNIRPMPEYQMRKEKSGDEESTKPLRTTLSLNPTASDPRR